MKAYSDVTSVCSIKQNSIKDVTIEEINNVEEKLEETQENVSKEATNIPSKSRSKLNIRYLSTNTFL